MGVKPKEARPQDIVGLINKQIKNVIVSGNIDPVNIKEVGDSVCRSG